MKVTLNRGEITQAIGEYLIKRGKLASNAVITTKFDVDEVEMIVEVKDGKS